MCDISTQCITIDERRPLQQLQMVTDNIITSEYIPQHLLYCQTHLAANHFEAPSNHELVCFKLPSYATCLIFIPLNLPADSFPLLSLKVYTALAFSNIHYFFVVLSGGKHSCSVPTNLHLLSCRTSACAGRGPA